MKYGKIALTTFSAIVLTSAMAYTSFAQQATEDDQQAQRLSETGEQTDNAKINLRVQIVRHSQNRMTTTMDSLRESAAPDGMQQMKLNADMTDAENADDPDTKSVTFNRATYFDEETGEDRSTNFSAPFSTKIIPAPEIENGDKFTVEVDPNVLLSAWQRLKEEQDPEDEDEDEEDENQVKLGENKTQGSVAGNSSKDDGNQDSDFGPDFEKADDPTITKEKCDIKVDEDQMAAIEQEKVLEDGEVVQECSETLTRYPLQKDFTKCPLQFNEQDMKALKQYVLYYEHPEDGRIQAKGCQVDEKESIPLNETAQGCGMKHDFDKGESVQLKKITYEKNGNTKIYADCDESDETFAHTITQDGCDPIVDKSNDIVTFQEQITIDKDGTTQQIRECQPNENKTAEIKTRVCDSPRYTHKFNNNQSHLNKDYFYEDNSGEEVIVESCAASTKTFEHKEDEQACDDVHDNDAKETRMRAKTYIDDPNNGGKTIIDENCEQVDTIPYVKVDEVWGIGNQGTVTLDLKDDTDTDQVQCYNSNRQDKPSNAFCEPGSGSFFGKHKLDGYEDKANWFIGDIGTSVTSQKYCWRNEVVGSFTTNTGLSINDSMSTQEPQMTQSFTMSHSEGWRGRHNFSMSGAEKINCSAPSCLLTKLEGHPKYLRGDDTHWIDSDTTTKTVRICGDGSSYEGESAN